MVASLLLRLSPAAALEESRWRQDVVRLRGLALLTVVIMERLCEVAFLRAPETVYREGTN